jgi:hypothetical protein
MAIGSDELGCFFMIVLLLVLLLLFAQDPTSLDGSAPVAFAAAIMSLVQKVQKAGVRGRVGVFGSGLGSGT